VWLSVPHHFRVSQDRPHDGNPYLKSSM
jgi:hypothetical protein